MDKTMLILYGIVCLLTIKGNAVVVQKVPNPFQVRNENFRYRCELQDNSEGILQIDEIRIYRRNSRQENFEEVVNVRRNTEPRIIVEEIQARGAVVEGRADTPNESFLQYEIQAPNTDCTDTGEYVCLMFINKNTSFVAGLLLVSPSVRPESPRIEVISQSNVKRVTGTRNAFEYTFNTTVALSCTVQAGNPPVSLTWCLQPSQSATFTELQAREVVSDSTSEEPSKNCYITRTSILFYTLRENVPNPTVRCVAHSSSTSGNMCDGNNPANVQLQGTENSVCPAPDVTIVPGENTVSSEKTVVTDTKISTTMSINNEVTGELSIINNTDRQFSSEGTTLLILGCVLVLLALTILIGGVVTFLKARHHRKETELKMIRDTYDALRMNGTNETSYTPIDSSRTGPRPPVSRQDSDGYMIPSVFVN